MESKTTCHRPKLPILDMTGSSDSIAVMLEEVYFDTRGCFGSAKWKDKQDKARYLMSLLGLSQPRQNHFPLLGHFCFRGGTGQAPWPLNSPQK